MHPEWDGRSVHHNQNLVNVCTKRLLEGRLPLQLLSQSLGLHNSNLQSVGPWQLWGETISFRFVFGGGEGPLTGVKMLSDPTEIPPPPYRETGVAIPLSHCVSCGIAATPPLLSLKMAYRNPKTGLTRGGLAEKARL